MSGLDILGATVVGDAGTGRVPSAPFDTPAQAAPRRAEVEAMAAKEQARRASAAGVPAWKWALIGLGVVAAGAATFALVGAHRGMSSEEAARAHREFHLARREWT